jgi:cell division septation protein DedD
MANDKRVGNSVREFRLEGVGLLLVGGLLLVLLGGAFYIGRWYERQLNPAIAEFGQGGEEDPLANVAKVEPAADVDEAASYFDDVEGGQKELEPQRQARQTETTAEDLPQQAPPPESAPAREVPRATGGSFFVQVFAGRDRGAAEGLVDELTEKGYTVHLDTEREGRGALYKVRVGGYPTREAARDVAARLDRDGYSGAWVKELE